MSMLASLLAPMLPKLLDWLLDRGGQFASFIWRKYESGAKKRKIKSDVDEQRDRLKGALDKAYDGEPITKDEKKEVIDAFRELVRDY